MTTQVSSTIYSNTTPSPNPSKLLELSVGLSLFFVALVVAGVAGLLCYRQRKSVDIEVSNKLKSQEKSRDDNTRESPYSEYIGTGGLQPAQQCPIYENFQIGQSTPNQFQRSAIQSDDTPSAHGVYHPCDPNDAIYSNDPALYQPDPEESLYIMPDA